MLHCGINSKVLRTIGTQAGCAPKTTNKAIQVGSSCKSYNRKPGKEEQSAIKHWTYDDLKDTVLTNRECMFAWLFEKELIAKERTCPICNTNMQLVECNDRSDGYRWECRRRLNGKRHKSVVSIRKGSWFERSNMTLEEVIKFTYWWCEGLEQEQIKKQLKLSPNTAVDWDSFCRETCEVTLEESSEQIGGVGKVVQIDESKFGKRKYHRGHKVEGQWVFGGIEDGSRKSFMVAVDKRDENTLLPIIKKYIAPGTHIISDCWKAYYNLADNGYTHSTVNHSKEFVNDKGEHTNRIEGHWRQAKVHLPKFGVKKTMFSSHLAEFLWRYMHKDEDLFECFLLDVKKLNDFM